MCVSQSRAGQAGEEEVALVHAQHVCQVSKEDPTVSQCTGEGLREQILLQAAIRPKGTNGATDSNGTLNASTSPRLQPTAVLAPGYPRTADHLPHRQRH